MSANIETLKKYRLTFDGRTRGAIGIFYLCSIVVEATDEESARLKLYETHETAGHGVRVVEVTL